MSDSSAATEPDAPAPRGKRAPRSFTARVEVSPGQFETVTFPTAAASRWGAVRLRQVPGSATLRFELRTWTREYRLTDKPQRDLGLPMHWQWYIVMGYLGKFFKVRRPSPRVTLIDLDSLHRHLEASEEPGFWTPERIERAEAARQSYNGKEHRAIMEHRAKPRDPRPVEDKGKPAPAIITKPRRPQVPHPDLFEEL